MSPPFVTALYAGLNGLILLWLTWSVIARRRSGGVSLGDGGDEGFRKLIRGHANAAETIPIAVLLLLLTELIGAPAIAVHIAGAAFTIGRVLHALHFTGAARFRFRIYGMALTLIALAGLSLGLVAHALTRLI